jgi:hypothetical protein
MKAWAAAAATQEGSIDKVCITFAVGRVNKNREGVERGQKGGGGP